MLSHPGFGIPQLVRPDDRFHIFLKRFMGSYGVRSEIEPSISPDEKKVFDSIAGQIQSNLDGAIQTLSVRPWTNSIETQSCPSCTPTSNTDTMLGWAKLASA